MLYEGAGDSVILILSPISFEIFTQAFQPYKHAPLYLEKEGLKCVFPGVFP